MNDRTELVRNGYDVIAGRYHAGRLAREAINVEWLDSLRPLVPETGSVVDLGCGAGVPITRYFADRGYDVTGYDLSEGMLQIAREQVPRARFEQSAMQDIVLDPESVDIVTSFFAIIHLDRTLHETLFKRIFGWLRPGGMALMTLGADDNPDGTEEDWLGAPMAWSHFDADTNLEMLRSCGFKIVWSKLEEWLPTERHLFVLACKGPAA